MRATLALAFLLAFVTTRAERLQAHPFTPSVAADSLQVGRDTVILGWKVRISPALSEHHLLATRTTAVLKQELEKISAVLPKQVLPELQEVPLSLEYHSPTRKVLHYWGSANPFHHIQIEPRLAGAIEISAPEYCNMPPDSLPLIKWFAASYVETVIGQKDQALARAYSHAVASGVYDVQVHGRMYFPFASAEEYFAVLSAAYFTDRLSYAPYSKARLRKLDPEGYAFLKKAWGK